MAAKRFGEFITSVQGTSKQIPRVKADESGFEFVEPASIPAFTVTNVSTDRAYNAADTTLDEVANVLGTLLADLATAGLTAGANGLQAFQWSTTEQVYPFEKGTDGQPLYCKLIAIPTRSAGQTLAVAHNVAGLQNHIDRVVMISGFLWDAPKTATSNLPYADGTKTNTIGWYWDYVSINIFGDGSSGAGGSIARVIYSKTL